MTKKPTGREELCPNCRILSATYWRWRWQKNTERYRLAVECSLCGRYVRWEKDSTKGVPAAPEAPAKTKDLF